MFDASTSSMSGGASSVIAPSTATAFALRATPPSFPRASSDVASASSALHAFDAHTAASSSETIRVQQ